MFGRRAKLQGKSKNNFRSLILLKYENGTTSIKIRRGLRLQREALINSKQPPKGITRQILKKDIE
jgi:hypothetical protein